jgi:PKD repeat protein
MLLLNVGFYFQLVINGIVYSKMFYSFVVNMKCMKRIILFVGLISAVVNGQATYTSANFASAGDSFFITTPTAASLQLDYEVTGTNFAWDYSALVPDTQETTQWTNPNSSGYKTVWCFLNGFIFNCNTQFNANFNLAAKLSDGLVLQGLGLANVISHLNKTNSALQNKMIGAQVTANGSTVPFVVSYTDPDDIYQFPMTFGATATNPFAINTDLTALGFPVQINATGQRTNEVVGWGTLVTPYGTFANVLKLKSTLVQSTTITANGTPQTTDRTTVSYQWFDPAHKIPVLDVSGDLVNSVWTPTSVRFMDFQRCLNPQAAFAYFPLQPDYDPATSGATVNFVNGSSNYDVSDWNFGDGSPNTSVKSPTHTFTCPGMKMVTLTVTNQFCDPDLTDTITIPIMISDSQNVFTTNVTATSTTLTADRTATGTTYQWLDCNNNNAPILGATNQIFTPSVDGVYAVRLTTNGCIDVSDCIPFTVLSLPEYSTNKVQLLPNPTSGMFEIVGVSPASIQSLTVVDLLGKVVATKPDLTSLAQGVYVVKIKTASELYQIKVVKK